MALTYVQLTAPGGIATFTVPFPVLNRSDLKVLVDGVETTAFTWDSSSVIRMNVTPSAGVSLLLKRVTPYENLSTDYVSGALLDEDTLDNAQKELFYIMQETVEKAEQTIRVDPVSYQWDSLNKRVANVGDAINDYDAITKHYLDLFYVPAMNTLLINTTTKATNAASSATSAAGSATAASTSATNASTSATNAATSATNANNSAVAAAASAASIGSDPLKANVASPALTGVPTAPTASAGTNTTQLATTAFATVADNLKANIASPTFTGIPAAPTASAGTSTTQLATTAFATTADNLKANIASPTFTGVPAAPSAAYGTNTTQIATTAFVLGHGSSTLPSMDGAASIGGSYAYARADHVHPADTSKAALSGCAFTGPISSSGQIVSTNCFSTFNWSNDPAQGLMYLGNGGSYIHTTGAVFNMYLSGAGLAVINKSGTVAMLGDIAVANSPSVMTALNAGGSAPIYACRAWCVFTVSGGVPGSLVGGNVSSITDNGSGDFTVNFITAMPDSNFAMGLLGKEFNTTSGSFGAGKLSGQTMANTFNAAWVRICGGSQGSTGSNDPVWMSVAIFR